MMKETWRSTEELEAGLQDVRRAPRDAGTLEMIVRRPSEGKREVLAEGTLDPDAGLTGDSWGSRPSRHMADGSPHPDKQINVMSSRAAELVAGSRERWALAGDQLYVDLDLSEENLPAGTRLTVGDAVLEITAMPHTGCRKFSDRYGRDAVLFVNSAVGKELNLRGRNAKVVRGGVIRTGDTVRKN